jgi:hypothetical protein
VCIARENENMGHMERKLKEHAITFRPPAQLLNMTVQRVRNYLALNEAAHDSTWTIYYIYYLMSKTHNIYKMLEDHQNKDTAGYVASLIVSAACRRRSHNLKYQGYQRFEEVYRKKPYKSIHINIDNVQYTYKLNRSTYSSYD